MRVLRRKTFLTLAVAVLLGLLSQRGLALPESQVLDQIRSVPVFTLADATGAPLIATSSGSDRPTTGVYVSWQDATEFLEGFRVSHPELAVEILPVSLAEIYRLTKRDNAPQAVFVPMQSQVAIAKSILRQRGEDAEQFTGVPLFLARSSRSDEGYLTIRNNGQETIPVFFKEDEAQAVLARLQEAEPDLARRMQLQVVALEGLLDVLSARDNQELGKMMLIPSQDSVAYVRALQPSTANAQNAQRLGELGERLLNLLRNPSFLRRN